jgi:hypothetical protein
MNLANAKDCLKCNKSLVFGNKDNCKVMCTCEDSQVKELFETDGRYCAAYCKFYEKALNKRDGKIPEENALEFMLAGQSEFIMHSTKTGDDFRFILNVKKSTSNENQLIILTSLIKASEKIYCGLIYFNKNNQKFEFNQGDKGKISPQSIDIRSLLFVLNKLYNKEHVENLELYHINKCGYCGKEFTVYEDTSTGIHKNCITKISIKNVFEYTDKNSKSNNKK